MTRKRHGPFAHWLEARFILCCLLLISLMIYMQGCAQSPTDKDGNSHQRTVTIICLFSMCEQEHADNTHGKINQTEGEEADLEATVPVSAVGGSDTAGSVLDVAEDMFE